MERNTDDYRDLILELFSRVKTLENEVAELKAASNSTSMDNAPDTGDGELKSIISNINTFGFIQEGADKKDYTKYKIVGDEDDTLYGKATLPLAIVKRYIAIERAKGHDISYDEVLDAFPDHLQGSYGVIKPLDKVKERWGKEFDDGSDKKKDGSDKKEYSDKKKPIPHRFRHKDDKDIINIDGKEYVVCTQWGRDNIKKFIDRAKELGIMVEEINR